MSRRDDREILLEQAAGAWRAQAPDGTVRGHPAWHDLDEAGRREAYERACLDRKLEAALDAKGRSTTARALLARILGGA